MGKKLGSHNFSDSEAKHLAELAAQGLSKTEAGRELGRSYWTIRAHSRKLGIAFPQREVKPPISKELPRPDLTATRARLRQLEDRLIQELARNGWTSGMAALELDMNHSTMWKYSKRLGVTWTRYGSRSVRGTPVADLAGLRRLRARAKDG
jgi:transcriptional regulator of acetoin/glycerol metabolism